MKEKIILIGGGGHCKACIEVIESTEKYNIIGILDIPSKVGQKILGYDILGTDPEISKFITNGIESFFVTIGQIESATLKKKIFENVYKLGGISPVIFSRSAIVSKRSHIGEGTIVMHGAKINADVVIGENCIVNTMANVEHDVQIGNHVHLSTGSIINGEVSIGNEVMIGSNSVIKNGVSICDNVLIGAGSVVIKNITNAGTYFGNPLKEIN